MMLGVDLMSDVNTKGNALLKGYLFNKFLGFMQVVDTNYEFAIFYSCQNEITPGMKSEYVLIAHRDPNLNNKHRVETLNVAHRKIS
jgi:hypothetical protein